MHSIELSIVIVNWNSREYLKRCIASIEAGTFGITYEVIVIDSGSFDGSEAMVKETYPSVIFLQSATNIGFGRANNEAAAHARGSVLLFLNPDTEVVDGAIERMYRHLVSRGDIGALGCRLLNCDGSLQTSCVQALPTVLNQVLNADILRSLFPRASLFGVRALFDSATAITEVQGVSGACMMLRQDVFVRAGHFSPEYFMYGEDLDLCFKTRRMGFRNYHASDALVIHHGGRSTQHVVSRFSAVMKVDSVSRLLRKSKGPIGSGGYRIGISLAALMRLLLLCLAAPFAIAVGARRRWHATTLKWLFVFRWGLGFEQWTADYNGWPREPTAAYEALRLSEGSVRRTR